MVCLELIPELVKINNVANSEEFPVKLTYPTKRDLNYADKLRFILQDKSVKFPRKNHKFSTYKS